MNPDKMACEAFMDFCDQMMIAEEGKISNWVKKQKKKREKRRRERENEEITLPKDIYDAYTKIINKINAQIKSGQTGKFSDTRNFNRTVNYIAANIEMSDTWDQLFSDNYSDNVITVKAKPIRDLRSDAVTYGHWNSLSTTTSREEPMIGPFYREDVIQNTSILYKLQERACDRVLSFAK